MKLIRTPAIVLLFAAIAGQAVCQERSMQAIYRSMARLYHQATLLVLPVGECKIVKLKNEGLKDNNVNVVYIGT